MTRVIFVAESDVAQTFPAGEQIVSFSGGGSGVSASAGVARRTTMNAKWVFMAPSAGVKAAAVGRQP